MASPLFPTSISMQRALSEEQFQKLLVDHEDGFSGPQLAARYGISISTVQRYLADAQAPRTVGNKKKKRKPLRNKKRVLYPCGTDAAYRRHKYRQEYPCTECLAAHAAKQKEWHDRLGKKATRPSKAN